MPRTDANARPARAAKEPLRFAAEAKYTTERKPSALCRAAESEQSDDDDSAPAMSISGATFVRRETEAAEAAGLAPRRADAPAFVYGKRPKKVKLPPGWKPSSPQEVEDYVKNLNSDELNKVMKLHHYAYFSKGAYKPMGKEAAKKWFKGYGLVVAPWHKQDFPGMCNSEALAQQRFAKARQEENDKRSEDATFERLEKLGQPKEKKSRPGSYNDLLGDDMVVEAFRREEAMPADRDRNRKVRAWFPTRVDVCVDCGRCRELVRVEHANGGPDDGKRRVPPCPEDNKGERADCDVAIHAAHMAGETLTEDGCEAVPKSHFTTFHDSLVDFYPGTTTS